MESWREELYTELYHHGIKGQKWGIRRYQNEDGTLTEEGRQRYLHDNMTAGERRRYEKGKLSRKDIVNISERQRKRLAEDGFDDPDNTEEARILRSEIMKRFNKSKDILVDSKEGYMAKKRGARIAAAILNGQIGYMAMTDASSNKYDTEVGYRERIDKLMKDVK